MQDIFSALLFHCAYSFSCTFVDTSFSISSFDTLSHNLVCQVASKNPWFHQTVTELLNALITLLSHCWRLFLLLPRVVAKVRGLPENWYTWMSKPYEDLPSLCLLDSGFFFPLAWVPLCLTKVVLVLETEIGGPAFNMPVALHAPSLKIVINTNLS